MTRTRKPRTARGAPRRVAKDKSRPLTLLMGDRLRHEPIPTVDPGGRSAEFRFSVPVLRVRDVRLTAAWYAKHLGFIAAPWPEGRPPEFAILGRDGVQLLVRQSTEHDRRGGRTHVGWDLYIWVDGADFDRLESSAAAADAIVRPRRTMGNHIAEIEVRDPDGYVLCIGGPIRAAAVKRA